MKYPIRISKYFLPAACLLLIGIKGKAQENYAPRFDSVMKAYEQLNWNAIVLVGNADSIFYEKSIGYRDVKKHLPLTKETLFQTASVGKMFTSTRILQLVQEGKINLTQPVKSLLPQWNLPNLDKITIHHLLTHTSGLASAWDHPDYDFKKKYTPAQVKKMMEEVPLVFQTPGERFAYSNIGYTLLGEIISSFDKMPFAASISEHIFKPAGITATGMKNIKGAAIPYYQVSASRFVVDDEMLLKSPKAGEGAGGWLLSAKDLYQFVQAYLKNRYLDNNGRALQATANYTIDSTKQGFRYGITLLGGKFETPHFIYGHNGGGKGFSLDAFFDPRTNLIVVMGSNQYASGYTITRNLFRVLYKEAIEYPQHSAAIKIIEGMHKMGNTFMINQPDSFFARVGVTPSEQMLAGARDFLELDKDYAGCADLMTVGRTQFPQSAYMWFSSGEIAVKSKKQGEAIGYFNRAKEIAKAANDNILLTYVEAALKKLSKKD